MNACVFFFSSAILLTAKTICARKNPGKKVSITSWNQIGLDFMTKPTWENARDLFHILYSSILFKRHIEKHWFFHILYSSTDATGDLFKRQVEKNWLSTNNLEKNWLFTGLQRIISE